MSISRTLSPEVSPQGMDTSPTRTFSVPIYGRCLSFTIEDSPGQGPSHFRTTNVKNLRLNLSSISPCISPTLRVSLSNSPTQPAALQLSFSSSPFDSEHRPPPLQISPIPEAGISLLNHSEAEIIFTQHYSDMSNDELRIYNIPALSREFTKETMSQIEDNLYLGSLKDSQNHEILKSKEISHILSLGDFNATFERDGIDYHIIPIPDRVDTNVTKYFKQAFAFIDAADTVLVHCHAGISRSATFVVGYLMRKHMWGLEEAYAYVREKRACVEPNFGFHIQLQHYEEILKGKED